MSGPEDKPRGSFFDALRDRSRVVSTEAGAAVPRRLSVAAAYGWRILVIAAVLGLGVWLVIQLKLLVVPMLVSILVTALLWPIFSWMVRHRFPKWLAIVVSAVGAIVVVGSLFWLVAWQVSREWSSVQSRSVAAMEQFRQYLIDGPLGLTPDQIDDLLAQGWEFIQAQAELLWSGALALGTTVGHVATGAVLSVFILLCLLADGGGIWRWTTKLFPKQAQPAVDGAARAGWVTVVTYARTQLLVATIDAVGIGLGAFFLGVPMALPIAVLVFFGAFVPIVGAVVTGTLAVILALVYNGVWSAVWMLVVILAVQQIEGHILQPLLMGSAVKVHPLAVVLVVAGGAMIAGIPGALFAVPIAAFINVVAVYLSSRAWETGVAPHGDLIWDTVPRTRRTRP